MTLARWAAAVLAAGLVSAADEAPKYDMANYLMGFLRKGPNYGAGDSHENERIFQGHIANINRMAAAGKLAVAGPFGDDGDIRGILIFKNTTAEEAKNLVAADPAVKGGQLILELHPWF